MWNSALSPKQVKIASAKNYTHPIKPVWIFSQWCCLFANRKQKQPHEAPSKRQRNRTGEAKKKTTKLNVHSAIYAVCTCARTSYRTLTNWIWLNHRLNHFMRIPFIGFGFRQYHTHPLACIVVWGLSSYLFGLANKWFGHIY